MACKLHHHPIAVAAELEHVLVLTYALPRDALTPLLPPMFSLDAQDGDGFVAVALVRARAMRPVGLPVWLGGQFLLAGYRVFVTYRNHAGRTRRGLYILRSDTDRAMMRLAGNLLTRYHYHLSRMTCAMDDERMTFQVDTPDSRADLTVQAAHVTSPALPGASVFADWRAARRYAGPLPYTFDYDQPTRTVVIVKGERDRWRPQPIHAHVTRCTFFDHPPFDTTHAHLSAAFALHHVPYRWRRGVAERHAVHAPSSSNSTRITG